MLILESQNGDQHQYKTSRKLGLKIEIDQKLESISAGTNTIIEENKDNLNKSPNISNLHQYTILFLWYLCDIYLDCDLSNK